MGDGTGCDNMTAVIVKFEQKLQELPATIDPTKTEDALLAAAQVKMKSANVSAEQIALKRSASPDTPVDGAEDHDENTSKSKRVKMESHSLESVDGKEKNSTDVITNTPASVDEQKESVVVSST